MRSPEEIRAEMGDRPAWNGARTKKSKPKMRYAERPAKVPAKIAAPWSSVVAEAWMRLAQSQDFDPPFNANYLAREIEARVSKDKFIQGLDDDRRNRLLAKMVEVFWKTNPEDGFAYVRSGDSSRSIATVFLVECWDDVRQYAFDSLRAAYLKAHGVAKPPPDYGSHLEDEMHVSLRHLRLGSYLAREQEARAEERDLNHLDEATRAVVSSAREKRSNS